MERNTLSEDYMNVLITGSKGFIGSNLMRILKNSNNPKTIMGYDHDNTYHELEEYCKKADVVFHLAAVLRPEKEDGYNDNIDITSKLIAYLEDVGNLCPVVFASSIQAALDNPYGSCKRVEEEKILEYGKKNNVRVYVYRFPNLFGTMSRPNYTSVIATFCYNTVKNLPIVVNNPAAQIKFSFVEDVLERVRTDVFGNKQYGTEIIDIREYYTVGLGELAYYMETIKRGIEPCIVRNDSFYQKLILTYNWYAENEKLFE